jgi:hypothetical protein
MIKEAFVLVQNQLKIQKRKKQFYFLFLTKVIFVFESSVIIFI